MLNPLLISLEKGKQFIAHANNAYEGGETGVSFDVGEIALPRYQGIYLQSCRRIDDLGSLQRTSSQTLYQQTSC
uniref:Unplaced genomic scaffold supercont1.3, whole genome shotgun sequence n=1 Tax=Cryptococcus bacillisporus CA1280 TaxID=1296109 RepID=A0A0D0VUU7_CRYGA|nr:hypothetical protein I312_01328 [Cryptococcus bacillisporus CA1280]